MSKLHSSKIRPDVLHIWSGARTDRTSKLTALNELDKVIFGFRFWILD